MSEAIRLVIWDLDDTYWKGTLSEGGISEYIQAHHTVVVRLAERGIISSICSKNDHGTARAVLEAAGIWQYFVFPSIDWSPKGARIRSILEAVQLRAETVLFLDDNHGNRAEAHAAVPGLIVADETLIATLLDDPRCAGKDDKALSRLRQYRLLEQRAREKDASDGDNRHFLRNSRITVTIDYEVDNHLDRAVELINRTNQLNFTKLRLAEDPREARRQLLAQLGEFDTRTGLVAVKDRFGDYGFCGFFLLRGHWGRCELLHFAFSCRVLGMGIEQWVYQRLGRPVLDVVGEVASDLAADPDWINVDGSEDSTSQRQSMLPAVRLRGPCELEVIDHFFRLDTPSLLLEVVVWKDGLAMLRHHSALLHQSFAPCSVRLAKLLQSLGAAGDVESHFLDPCEDGTLLVYNNHADAHVDVYRHKSLPLALPMWLMEVGRLVDVPADELDAYIERNRLDAVQAQRIHRMCAALRADFELVDESDDATFRRMYSDIVARVPANALLVWVLPHEIFTDEAGEKFEHSRQKRLNLYAREAAAGAANVRVLSHDEAFPVRTEEDVAADGHFARAIYHRFYLTLRDIHAQWLASRAAAAPLPKPATPTSARRRPSRR